MIVLDTNVISELTKADRSERVVAWFNENINELALPTPMICELFAGAEAMAEGRRKTAILARYRELCSLFEGRILTFDFASALAFSNIAIECRRQGKPINTIDCQIASIARIHRSPIATRDADFEPTGVELINPWNA